MRDDWRGCLSAIGYGAWCRAHLCGGERVHLGRGDGRHGVWRCREDHAWLLWRSGANDLSIPGVCRCRRDGSGGVVVVRNAWLSRRLGRLWWEPVLVLVCGHAVLRGMRGQVLEVRGGYHAGVSVAARSRSRIGLSGHWWTRHGCVGRGIDGRSGRDVLRVLRRIGSIVRRLRVGECGCWSTVTTFPCVSLMNWGGCGVRVAVCHGDGLRRWLRVCLWLRIGDLVC